MTKRRSPRYDRPVRIGFKTESGTRWRQANAINISSEGIFFISYDERPPEGPFEIEIYDLNDRPVQTVGEVAWIRTWHEGPTLPGFGVRFRQALPKNLRLAG